MGNDYIEEQKYLEKSLNVINENISELEEKCDSGISNVRELSKYHWETKSEMDYIEKAITMNDVNHTASLTNESLYRLRRLRKAAENPFFGKIRIDFGDNDEDSFYIGITSIMKDNDLIVNDWRSPIATLFYNSKLGDTKYKAPAGIINCKLLQRKQIKIKDNKIDRIIDSDIHLTDDELQEVLSKSSDGKMKNIITTIQEEQNEVIRNLQDSKMIVQGCAGSGKTSVALHRLSYLLYNDEKSSSENMLIFSPSDTFSSYISNVLPDIGDDNVLQTTFSDFAHAFIKKFDKIESFSEFLTNYYEPNNNEDKITEEKNRLNAFKFSDEYKKALDKYIKNCANSYRFKEDISINGIYIPCTYLNKILDLDSTSSLQEKIDIITDEIYNLLRKKAEIKKSSIRVKVTKDLVKPEFDSRSMYNKFLSSQEFIEAYGQASPCLNKKLLEYPDMIGMLYLNFEFMGYPDNNIIHHLVIDEVQDYIPIQMDMISKMFKGATITVFGDANQTINPFHKYDSLEDMKKELGNSTKYVELNKAYRSSPEIMNYVKKILGLENIQPVRNSTGYDVEVKEVDKKDLFKTLVTDVLAKKEKGSNKICIITKSNKEAKAIYEGLKDSVGNIKVLSDTEEFGDDVTVAPSYIAKGLEFDTVICYNNPDNSYNENESNLYYVVCTRAQHNLIIYNEPKKLIKKVK